MDNNIEIPSCPVVRPTMKEFSNFEEYCTKLENTYAKNYGMVKVVAPKSWRPRTKNYTTSLQDNTIPNPIEQNCFGKGGIYECLHIIKKSMPVKDYVKKSLQFDYISDGKSQDEVESMFWKNISFSPPIYGADFQDTLFDKNIPWNLSELDNILNQGTTGSIAGVNTPYLYMGHWKTLFAWHTEDQDLGALNYLHYGKPKFWYSIPQSDGHYLEKMAKLYFADNFGKCSEFLRHKTTVINPYLLKKKFPEVRITKMIHNPREFMVVFSGCYHTGFNFGYNIAESVNYGTINWLDYFLKSNNCKCDRSQVNIDPEEFYRTLIKNNPRAKNFPQVKRMYADLQIIKKKEQQQMIQQQEHQLQLQYNKSLKKVKNSYKYQRDSETSNQTTAISDYESDQENSKKQSAQSKNKIINKKIKKQQQQQNDNLPKKQQQQSQQKKISKKQQMTNQQQQEILDKQIIPQQIIFDEYIQCDNCMDWKQLQDKKQSSFLRDKKQFFCKDISEECKTNRLLRSKSNF